MDERPIFWHYPHYGNQGGSPGSAVRQGSYKLIKFYENQSLELYDLSKDIGEKRNIADALPQKRDSLHNLLNNWLEETGALFPSTNTAYEATN